MANLTRRGARSVTTDLDRIASLLQYRHEDLGLSQKVAYNFALFCDHVSDNIERHAIKMAKLAADDAEETEEEEAPVEKKEASKKSRKAEEDKTEKSKKTSEEPAVKAEEDKAETASKKKATAKKAEDETGLSVDHGTSGFDANVIGDEVGGPKEIIEPPSEPWMDAFFAQGWYQELRELQQAGVIENAAARGQIITKAAKQSLMRLRRLASSSKLSNIEDMLKMIHAKLSISDMTDVKALAPDVKKQIDAVSKVRDAMIEQQATGIVEPQTLNACDKIVQAISEQIPYLQQIVMGVDAGSPVALLEFQRLVGGGSLKDLIALGASIVVDAAKLAVKKEEVKEASIVVAEEEVAKPAEEEDSEDEDSEDEDSEEEDSEDEDSEDEGKTASFGYDLFAK